MEDTQSTTRTHQFLSFRESFGTVRHHTAIIPMNFYFGQSHLRHVVTSREYHSYVLCVRSAISQQKCGRTLYFCRITQLQGCKYRLHDVASHITQSAGSVIPPSAPVPRMINLVVRTNLCRTSKQIPVQSRRNLIRLFRSVQALWPDRTVCSTFYFCHFTDFTVPDPFANQVCVCSGRTLVTHLSGYVIFFCQVGQQTRFVNRVSQRFLSIYVFAHCHCISSDDGVSMVGCCNQYGVDGFAHFVIHLTIIPILFSLRMTIEYRFCIFPVDIAKCYDIFCFFHVLQVGITHTADTDGCNVQLVGWSSVSVRFSQDGTRNNRESGSCGSSSLKK